jgi:RNA polymerase sigma factor (sigma-70 family)
MSENLEHSIAYGVNQKMGKYIELAWKSNAALVNKLISQMMGQTPFNEDLAADVLVALLVTDRHFKSEDDITRFLDSTTINICRDAQKRNRTREDHEGRVIYHFRSMEQDDIEIAEAAAYQQKLIRLQIAKIPGKAGRVMSLHLFDKLSAQDIAARLGNSERTIDNLLSEARAFLKMNKDDIKRHFAYPLIIFILIYLYESL